MGDVAPGCSRWVLESWWWMGIPSIGLPRHLEAMGRKRPFLAARTAPPATCRVHPNGGNRQWVETSGRASGRFLKK
jgi:hypothetical protein